jgi:hypothetical protein
VQFILSIVSIVQGPCSIVMRSLVVVPKIPIQVRGDWWFSLAHLRTPGICRSPTCLKVMHAMQAHMFMEQIMQPCCLTRTINKRHVHVCRLVV